MGSGKIGEGERGNLRELENGQRVNNGTENGGKERE